LVDTDTELITAAEDAMRDVLHPSIFNHTMRVRHLATHLAHDYALDYDALVVAALFHDAGTADEYDGEQRFELEGADAAARFLERFDWSPERIRPVWEAITLHSSAGIAERFGPIAQLVRTGVLIDLGLAELPPAPTHELASALDRAIDALPRLDVERVLPEAVVAQALRPGREGKAPPFSWPGALVADHLARARRNVTGG
jgi:putative nucleotidyltransferase with HDIG domain